MSLTEPSCFDRPSEGGTKFVATSVLGRVGILTLNRPKALNALNHHMVTAIHHALKAWESDPHVDLVIIRSSSRRAFCAGGDIKEIGRHAEPVKRRSIGQPFFQEEYLVDLKIHNFPKPIVSLIDGVAMGGGLGLAIHASHSIVSENATLAMPETQVGLFPDVGSSYFLCRCVGNTGRFLGLTGASVDSHFATKCGLVDHMIPFASFDELVLELGSAEVIDRELLDSTISRYESKEKNLSVDAMIVQINELFSGDTLQTVMSNISHSHHKTDWVARAKHKLASASPTSLALTWHRMSLAEAQSLEQVLELDLRNAVRMVERFDFFEGVRAVLVDKDGKPSWTAKTLDQVDVHEIAALCEPL